MKNNKERNTSSNIQNINDVAGAHVKDNSDIQDDEENQEGLSVIDGIPATSLAFHKAITTLLPFRSYENHLEFESCTNDTLTQKSSDPRNNLLNQFHDELVRDCTIAFTARPKESDQAYSSGSTFFIPCQMKPRCALEALALDIFKNHTKILLEKVSSSAKVDDDQSPALLFDPERSGAEWWTLVMDTTTDASSNDDHSNGDSNSSLEANVDNEDDDVGMHFDADYGLEDMLPCLIHPHISTITYLSNVGVPTMILDKKSPPPEDAPYKKTLEGSIKKGYLSYPKIGKHVAFDGRLLHGASSSFFPSLPDSSSSTPHKRITFLVNIWYSHIPIDADLLPDEYLAKMAPCPWYQYDYTEMQNMAICPKSKLSSEYNRISKRLKGEPIINPFKLKQLNDFDQISSFKLSDQCVSSHENFSEVSTTKKTSSTTISAEKDDTYSKTEKKEVHTVICGRAVTITFNSNIKQLLQILDHVAISNIKKSKNDQNKAKSEKILQSSTLHAIRDNSYSSVEIFLGEKNLTLDVGEEVTYSEDDSTSNNTLQ